MRPSEGDEVALRPPVRGRALEAEDDAEVECMSDARQRVEVGAVPAALDAGDLRVARPDEVGQLLLREPLVHAVLDEQPGDLPEPLALCLLRAVLGAARGP